MNSTDISKHYRLREPSSEVEADGKLVDAIRNCWGSHVSLDSLKYLKPNNGCEIKDKVFLINGVMTDVCLHFQDMQALANTGAEVIGIHNSTFGLLRDLRECINDLLERGQCPATNTVASLIRSSLSSAEELHFVGHSQGAIIISRALNIVAGELKQSGSSDVKVEKQLAHLKVETYGGGAAQFVNGPQYVHVDNWLDPIPFNTGVGFASRLLFPKANPGKGAVQYTFFKLNKPWKRLPDFSAEDKQRQLARFIDYMIHGPADIYFPQRKSFEEMRSQKFQSDERGFTQVHK